jgi:hypothetical protein
VTRAVVERPILFSGSMVRAILAGTKTVTRRIVRAPKSMRDLASLRCPYGAPGDRLWVRETWQTETHPDDRDAAKVSYRADGEVHCEGDRWTWRPSIHMPRWASRITLNVVSTRMERLHSITEEDAIAEGVDAVSVADVPRNGTLSRVADFAQLWQMINGKRAPWASNPPVWRVEFKADEVSK